MLYSVIFMPFCFIFIFSLLLINPGLQSIPSINQSNNANRTMRRSVRASNLQSLSEEAPGAYHLGGGSSSNNHAPNTIPDAEAIPIAIETATPLRLNTVRTLNEIRDLIFSRPETVENIENFYSTSLYSTEVDNESRWYFNRQKIVHVVDAKKAKIFNFLRSKSVNRELE